MYKDEILEEIHKYREEYARSFNYDLHAIFNDLRKKQIAHEHRVVKLPIKQRSRKSLASIIHELESESKKNGEVASSELFFSELLKRTSFFMAIWKRSAAPSDR